MGLYPLDFLFLSWVLYMRPLWPLECWAQSPSCLPFRLPSTKLPSPEGQSQDTYFSTGAAQLLALGLKDHTSITFSSLSHVDTLPPTPVRSYSNLPGHTLATLTAKSLDLTDLMQLPWGLSWVCFTGERFISPKF